MVHDSGGNVKYRQTGELTDWLKYGIISGIFWEVLLLRWKGFMCGSSSSKRSSNKCLQK